MTDHPPKLQRRLHRQRGRPRTSPPIRDTEELKQMFHCNKAELPERLAAAGVDYHRDSAGNYWAALLQPPASVQPPALARESAAETSDEQVEQVEQKDEGNSQENDE